MDESIRAVLFDAVGTLIRPARPVHDVYAAAGRCHGSRHDANSVELRFRQALVNHEDDGETDEPHERDRWRRIVGEVFDDVRDTESLFAELWDYFANSDHWSLYDDVRPVWAVLRERNIIIGIASNFDARLTAICRAIQPLDDADHVFCSSMMGFSKPRPEFYALAARQLDIAPRSILMVGDSFSHDVAAPRAAGWQSRWLRREGELSEPTAIGRLSDILLS